MSALIFSCRGKDVINNLKTRDKRKFEQVSRNKTQGFLLGTLFLEKIFSRSSDMRQSFSGGEYR